MILRGLRVPNGSPLYVWGVNAPCDSREGRSTTAQLSWGLRSYLRPTPGIEMELLMDRYRVLRPLLIIGAGFFGFLAVAAILRFWLGVDALGSGFLGLFAGILCGAGMASVFWGD